jgi:hypothetical protein
MRFTLLALLLACSGCLDWIIPSPHQTAAAGGDDAGVTPDPTMTPDPGTSPDLSTDDGGDAGVTAFMLKVEAESGTLTAPMAIVADALASGGNYIVSPAGTTGGLAVLTVSVPADGDYAVWGRVIGPTDASNSFQFSVDTNVITDPAVNGVSTIWDLPISTTWTWSHLNMRIDAAGTDMNLTTHLTAGSHMFYINEREAASQLDEILVTSDLNFVPAN